MQVVLFILGFILIITCVYICVRPRSPHDWKKINGQDSDSSPRSRPQKNMDLKTHLCFSMESGKIEKCYWCQETHFEDDNDVKGLHSAYGG